MFTSEAINKFTTPTCSPWIEECLRLLREGVTANELREWVDGYEPFCRSGAVAVVACCMFGSDDSVAFRLGITQRSIYAYRFGERRPGGDEPGIGQGNCQGLCELVVSEYRKRRAQSETPEYVLPYRPDMGPLAEGQWIEVPQKGTYRVTSRGKGGRKKYIEVMREDGHTLTLFNSAV